MSSDNRDEILRKIQECKKEIEKYLGYQHELEDAKSYCEESKTGIDLLTDEQYEKVKSHCIEAIGEEQDLLSALQVKHTNMYQICTNISENLKDGIAGIEAKIEELREELQRLYNQL